MNAISPLSSASVPTSSFKSVNPAKIASPAPAAVVEVSAGAHQSASAAATHGGSNIIWGSAPSR